MSQKLVENLQQEFGADILAVASQHGDETVTVDRDKLLAVLGYLRDKQGCEQLSDVVGVHYPERDAEFEINYLMRSWQNKYRVRIRVNVAEDESIPTATTLYASANWHEREVWDMFGVPFSDLGYRAQGEQTSRLGWAVAATLMRHQGEVWDESVIGTGQNAPTGPALEEPPRIRTVRVDGETQSSAGILTDYVRVLWLTPAQDRLFLDGADRKSVV